MLLTIVTIIGLVSLMAAVYYFPSPSTCCGEDVQNFVS